VIDPANNTPAGDFLLEVDPGFKLTVPSNEVAFDLGGEIDFVFYANNPLLNRILSSANLALGINRKGVFGFELADNFNRSDNNNLVAVPFTVISNYNDASAKFEIRPGGGALTFEPGYRFLYNHFEPSNSATPTGCDSGNALCDPSTANTMDYYVNNALLNIVWRFLPKTSILLNSNYAAVGYPNVGTGANANAPLGLFNATLGLSGLVTSRIEVVLKAGYAQTILNSGDEMNIPGLQAAGNEHTFVGQAQVGYLFSSTAFIRAGYARLLLPSPTVLAYYSDDRPYLNVRALIGGRLTLHLDFTYDILTFPVNGEGMPVGRTDQNMWVDVGPEVEILRWLIVSAGYVFSNHDSNDAAAFVYNTTSAFGGYGYSNNEVYLKVTAIY